LNDRLTPSERSKQSSLVHLAASAIALAFGAGCGHSGASTVPATASPLRGSCFLLYELGVGQTRRQPDAACATRVTPASTFKIPHALAALDSGVLAGPDISLPFQGPTDVPASWKRAHTLATAMRYSVVWYFQRVASMLGVDRERDYLARLAYGNLDTSGGLTTFWLDGSLRISPDEQEVFMRHLYEDALPVSADAMRAVREMLVQPPGVVVNALGEHPFDAPWPDGTVLSAKTGTADDVTWLVGSVRRLSRSWVFVSCVLGPAEHNMLGAIHLAADSLREAGVL
jgi:beta-lactamase class D